jgi:hypothetical protein
VYTVTQLEVVWYWSVYTITQLDILLFCSVYTITQLDIVRYWSVYSVTQVGVVYKISIIHQNKIESTMSPNNTDRNGSMRPDYRGLAFRLVKVPS